MNQTTKECEASAPTTRAFSACPASGVALGEKNLNWTQGAGNMIPLDPLKRGYLLESTGSCESQLEHGVSLNAGERKDLRLIPFSKFLSQLVQTTSYSKYYSSVPACRCRENEIKHVCRYHNRQAAENLLKALEKEKNKTSPVSSPAATPQQHGREASKDIYIEVAPGTYSVTATSEDMVKQTHVVDITAGQSIDLTFSL
ncbi:A-kinase-interacting protein 1 isoform X2 [Alligator mississippiensis]|nr:A-kinase-interacting protein 1 isoform X2 [Alligator mississippiensis]